MGKSMYKMVPVSPDIYAGMEASRIELGLASFNELLAHYSRRKKIDGFGCWKDQPWARNFKRENEDRF